MADATRALKVSFEVWRELVSKLRDPGDTLEGVIRRLLSLPEGAAPRPAPPARRAPVAARAAAPRVATDRGPRIPARGLAGVPEGTRIRGTYKGKTFTGRVEDGVVHVDGVKGRTFGSLSAAAEHHSRGHQNGWEFWEAQAPGSREWVRADVFRRGSRRRAPEGL